MLKNAFAKIDPLFAILILATFIRFWHLDYPTKLTFDEFHYVPAAKILVGVTEHPGLEAWKNYPLITKSPDINFSHPPLGKFIIGAGVRMFGDSGLGWRVFPAIFGMISLIIFYFLSLQLLNDKKLATFAVFLLSFDFMHILQSRIAMLDVFLMCFDLLAVLAFLKLTVTANSKIWQITASLAIALSVSTKYVAVIAAFQGAAVFWILSPLDFKKKLSILVQIAVSSFTIYSLWAFYYFDHGYSYWEWLQYHLAVSRETLGPLSTHSYGSSPFEWLFNSKPILYHFDRVDTQISVIYALGNPVLWLGFLFATFLVFANYWQKRDKVDLAVIWWFLLSYVPLIFILWRRQGFIYHMLPSVPIMCLLVIRALTDVLKRPKVTWGFSAAVVLALAIGFPVVIGTFFPEQIYYFFNR